MIKMQSISKQFHCKVIELKPDALNETKKWTTILNERKREVKASLKREGIEVECIFLWSKGKKHYLVYFIKTKDIRNAVDKALSSQKKIDIQHQDWKKKCWKTRNTTEMLFAVTNSF